MLPASSCGIFHASLTRVCERALLWLQVKVQAGLEDELLPLRAQAAGSLKETRQAKDEAERQKSLNSRLGDVCRQLQSDNMALKATQQALLKENATRKELWDTHSASLQAISDKCGDGCPGGLQHARQGASGASTCGTHMAPPAGRVWRAGSVCLGACSIPGRDAVAATCFEGPAARWNMYSTPL